MKRVPVYGRTGVVAYAIVDERDHELAMSLRWNLVNGYVVRWDGTRLHRLIMGLPKGRVPEVDHRDRDPLNNRRSNLRVCDRSVNNSNRRPWSTTGIRGVTANRGRFEARVGRRYLGSFTEIADAISARESALS